MITLTGTLRQAGEVTIKERKLLKLWVEHTSPRENGVADLKIEELFLEPKPGAAPTLPKHGEQIAVIVRPYPKGRDVGFQALGIAGLSGVKA